ncbi:MAG: sulfur reduction protein DsrS [Gammaproteobacteria bacterium]
MDLSSEDSLRLNVLLANPLQAVRIDESSMTVHALSDQGEASVKLNPRGRDDQYLKRVRELLSSQVLGSPGGYPVFLRRWTRMGQARDNSLEQLLLLGEPEAVVAVVHANGLTDEIARRAWWAMPVADNARRMLERECVVRGTMGPVLAEYLVEYLPFETEHRAMLESVRLVLQPGLISAELRDKLWRSARRKTSYYVGFMQASPDSLPEQNGARRDAEPVGDALAGLQGAGNPVARQLCRCVGVAGQAFLQTAEAVLNKPADQDVVVELLNALQSYFSPVCPQGECGDDMPGIVDGAGKLLEGPSTCPVTAAAQAVLEVLPECRNDVRALLALAQVRESLVNPIFSRTDAIGSVMRKKLEPLTSPMREQIDQLLGRL